MDQTENDRVAFDYIKGNLFRVCHVDGVIGSATPSGFLHIACYSERPAIPRRMVYEIAQDGHLGEEILSMKETRDSIVRELDVDLLMTVQVAASLRDWIDVQLKNIEEMKKITSGGR